jgi:hypothetical protein
MNYTLADALAELIHDLDDADAQLERMKKLNRDWEAARRLERAAEEKEER